MIENCTSERDTVRSLITGAGIAFGHSKKGRTETKLVIASANISVPLTIKVGDLMAELLPDSPSWYNIGSAVTHSVFWGLRDVVQSRPGEPLNLLPDVMEFGTAAEAAISASGLILDRCGRYYGHDPQVHVQRARQRREKIDALMRRAATSNWAQLPAWRPSAGTRPVTDLPGHDGDASAGRAIWPWVRAEAGRSRGGCGRTVSAARTGRPA